jgi:hypothetical protein
MTLHLLVCCLLAAAVPAREVLRIPEAGRDATAGNNQRKIVTTGPVSVLGYVTSGGEVAVARWSGRGRPEVVRLSRPGIRAGLVALAAAGEVVHAVWVDYGTVGHVWYTARTPSGWQEGRKISPGPPYAGFPAIAVDASGVHVVWYGVRPGELTRHGAVYEILYTRGQGGRWSRPEVISPGLPDALNPALALSSDGTLHAAWYQFDGRWYRATYRARREGWQPPEFASGPGFDAYGVALDVGPDGTVHLVWERRERGGPQIAYARRSGRWTREEILGSGERPVVAVSSGTVYVAWESDGGIHARARTTRWSDPVRLGPGSHPTLAPGPPPLIAWTRPEGRGYAVVVASLAPAPSGVSGEVVVAVLLIAGALWLGWRLFRQHPSFRARAVRPGRAPKGKGRGGGRPGSEERGLCRSDGRSR